MLNIERTGSHPLALLLCFQLWIILLSTEAGGKKAVQVVLRDVDWRRDEGKPEEADGLR